MGRGQNPPPLSLSGGGGVPSYSPCQAVPNWGKREETAAAALLLAQTSPGREGSDANPLSQSLDWGPWSGDGQGALRAAPALLGPSAHAARTSEEAVENPLPNLTRKKACTLLSWPGLKRELSSGAKACAHSPDQGSSLGHNK